MKTIISKNGNVPENFKCVECNIVFKSDEYCDMFDEKFITEQCPKCGRICHII